MIGIRVGVHVTDGHALDSVLFKRGDTGLDANLIEQLQDSTGKICAFGDREAELSRYERDGLLNHDVVLIVAALIADLEDVAEPFGGDKCSLGALPLEDCVGCERRAVQNKRQRPCLKTGLAERGFDPGDHPFFGSGRCRQHLGGRSHARRIENNIRERAADIHRQPHAVARHRHILPPGVTRNRSPPDIQPQRKPARAVDPDVILPMMRRVPLWRNW